MRPASALVLLMFLAGCTAAFDVTGREWTKPDASSQQVTFDQTECARKAFEAGWTPDLLLGGLLDVARLGVENSVQAGTYRGCLTEKGYQRRAG